ncbi:hypothetical protein CYMTET_38294 [Cymbomonas tetramitiformis]|uniref:Pentatricopeptide repeat-containing protein n=1 Tax=Cymbomonas tetramitiformis TaxID=36881 RepID=A0AAE0CC95_9CHLO|nr:hypothetical protein CYMTET_38294 [Cymbomonas tetramitiformis]
MPTASLDTRLEQTLQRGDVVQCLHLFQKAVQQKEELSLRSFKSIVQACVGFGDFECAAAALVAVENVGLVVDEELHVMLLQCYVAAGEYAAALEYLQDLSQAAEAGAPLAISVEMVNAVLKGVAYQGTPEHAAECLRLLRANGLAADEFTTSWLMRLEGVTGGRMPKVLQYWRKLPQPTRGKLLGPRVHESRVLALCDCTRPYPRRGKKTDRKTWGERGDAMRAACHALNQMLEAFRLWVAKQRPWLEAPLAAQTEQEWRDCLTVAFTHVMRAGAWVGDRELTWLRPVGLRPRPNSYNALLKVEVEAAKLGMPHWAENMDAVLRMMAQDGAPWNQATYSLMLQAQVMQGHTGAANDLMQKAHRKGVDVGVYGYNILAQAAAHTGDLDAVMSIRQCMAAMKVAPDACTHTAMFTTIKNHMQQLRVERGEVYTDAARLRDSGSVWLDQSRGEAAAEESKMDPKKMMQYAEADAQLSGVPQSLQSFTAHLQAMGAVGRVQEMLDNVYRPPEALAEEIDTMLFNTAIFRCGREGRVEEAFYLKKEMARLDIKPDIWTFNTLISCCMGQEEIDHTWELLDELEQLGLEPNLVTFNSLMKAFIEADQPDHIDTCLREMEALGIEPNATTEELVMKARMSQEYSGYEESEE